MIVTLSCDMFVPPVSRKSDTIWGSVKKFAFDSGVIAPPYQIFREVVTVLPDLLRNVR